MQVVFLWVFQECKIILVGGMKEILVDIRVIVVIYCDLCEFVESGKIREDLFYCFYVYLIEFFFLCDCFEDILDFFQYYKQKNYWSGEFFIVFLDVLK